MLIKRIFLGTFVSPSYRCGNISRKRSLVHTHVKINVSFFAQYPVLRTAKGLHNLLPWQPC